MEIRYSWGTGAADGQPREMSVPDFDTFEKTIRDNRTTIGVLPEDTKDELDAKKCRLPYIWHGFKTGAAHRRRSASAGDLYYLPLDLDGVTKNGWECIQEILSAYRGFAYTTASHTHPVAKGEYRIRIILAPSRAVSPAEKQPLLQTIQSEIMSVVDLFYDGPAKWDDSVYRPAQMVFLPDERAQFWSFTGQAVDVDTLLANAPVPIELPDDTEHDDLTRLVDLENINSNTFDDLRSALWHPGMLQHAENYPTWAAMGNRLAWFKDTDHEEKAKALWVEWSATSDKYDHEVAEQKWQEHLTADRTGYAAIFKQAQDRGWINPGIVDDVELPISKPHLGGYGKPGRFIVEGFIPEGVTAIYGQSSTFKSYLALSIALRIALMRHRWAGRNLKGGAVLYIAAEGGSSIYPRVGAWADRFNDGKPVKNFYILPRAVDLADPKMVKALLNEVKRIINASGHTVRMVVIDTLSQSMTSGDENSAGDMARFMAGATRVSTESGAAVVVVHHSGKDGSKGMRGSSAAFANVDAVIRVDRIEDSVNLINEKQRTGPTQPTASYSVPIVNLPDYVIAENEAFDNEYTSSEGEVYAPVCLTTERVFEDIPMAEVISTFDDESASKGLTGNNAIMVGLVENSGGRIARAELRKQWIDGEGKESSFRTTLKRSIEGGYLCKDENEEIFLPPILIDN
ncbi:AAA family ATPase [Xenorhabdus bovienii]|uniref:Primase C-terminal 2 domain-containing protein n=1 Tax=Xenorhabdus bovienii str. Intermedium TaxID=1379677 RepID=A0A077QDC8_XENBV|nr:AAA family ATPase [Xenorhabdus bovienii]CDH31454.1 hypothetical protein XBI1_1530012 [Xenorhabdus bovienii str. Intermedium]